MQGVSYWYPICIIYLSVFLVSTTRYSSSPPLPQIIPSCAKLQVQNGYVSLYQTVKGETVLATILCKEGFIIKGKDTLTCTESGKWDGEVPNCIREWLFFPNQDSLMEELVYHKIFNNLYTPFSGKNDNLHTVIDLYHNLSKIGPPSKLSLPPFWMKLLQRVLFSLKSVLTYIC